MREEAFKTIRCLIHCAPRSRSRKARASVFPYLTVGWRARGVVQLRWRNYQSRQNVAKLPSLSWPVFPAPAQNPPLACAWGFPFVPSKTRRSSVVRLPFFRFRRRRRRACRAPSSRWRWWPRPLEGSWRPRARVGDLDRPSRLWDRERYTGLGVPAGLGAALVRNRAGGPCGRGICVWWV